MIKYSNEKASARDIASNILLITPKSLIALLVTINFTVLLTLFISPIL